MTSSENPYASLDSDDLPLDATWEFFSAENAREYLRRQRGRVTPGRAVPFLSDFQARHVFTTVTLDNVREEE